MSWADEYYADWSARVADEFSRHAPDPTVERDVDEAVRRYAETVEDEGMADQ